jgi:hypothetical protein
MLRNLHPSSVVWGASLSGVEALVSVMLWRKYIARHHPSAWTFSSDRERARSNQAFVFCGVDICPWMIDIAMG